MPKRGREGGGGATIQSLLERDGCKPRASLRALRDSHSSSSPDVRRLSTEPWPSPLDSRRMSGGEGACEGREEKAFNDVVFLRVVSFFSKSPLSHRRTKNCFSPPGAINSLFFLTVLTVPPSCFHAASCSPVVAMALDGSGGGG